MHPERRPTARLGPLSELTVCRNCHLSYRAFQVGGLEAIGFVGSWVRASEVKWPADE